LVIACNLPESSCHTLGNYLFPKHIPFVVLKTYGLFGTLRSAFNEVAITESHPTNDRFDLYVHPSQLSTFPKLEKYIDSFDLNKCDDYVHAHIPYIVILGQAIKAWTKEFGKPPKDFPQQKHFKESINKMRRKNKDMASEENFDEAVQFAYRCYEPPVPDDFVLSVLNDSKAKDLTKESSTFWVLVAALNEFRSKEGHGCFPVSAALPDMTSETKHYVALKQIFAEKAKADEALISAHVTALWKKLGKDEKTLPEAKQIDYFVKNVRGLHVVRTRSLDEELTAKTFPSEDINELLEEYVMEDPDEKPEEKLLNPKNIHWYFALRSAEIFQAEHGHYPGTANKDGKEDLDGDSAALVKINDKLFSDLKIRQKTIKECLAEITRYGASEIHTVSAFIGGVAAQEVIKILTKQYVPLNNTFIYNGIFGSCSILKF